MPPAEKPLKREEEKTPVETVVPLGLTIEQYAHFSAKKAANAEQSARQSASHLADNYQQMGKLATEVQRANNNARDAKVIGLAIAEHLKIDLTKIVLSPSVSNMQVAESAGNQVSGPRKKVPTHPSYHPPTFNAALVLEEDEEEATERTVTGNHIIVDTHHYKQLTMTAKQYEQMKIDRQEEFDRLQAENAKRVTLKRLDRIYGAAWKVAIFVAGGIALTVLKALLAPHL